MNYPEHEKLKKVSSDSQTIGEFLEWLSSEQKITLCTLKGDDFYPDHLKTEDLLAEYFGINIKKLELEKREMLEEIRKRG